MPEENILYLVHKTKPDSESFKVLTEAKAAHQYRLKQVQKLMRQFWKSKETPT